MDKLDEVLVSINDRQLYVWRAVDSEGEVLEILVQPRRDRKADRRQAVAQTAAAREIGRTGKFVP